MSVKIRDLAKQLNLSVATISKALTDSHEISPETKQRVFELAKKLNYTPNPYASSLRKRSSKTIAVVLPEAILNEFKSGRVDGILISVSEETTSSDHIKEVSSSAVPVVFFDRVCEDVKTAKVITDDFESGYKATQHLAEQGCKKIIYLSVSADLSINKYRMEGYRKALKDYGIKEADTVYCGNNLDENYHTIKEVLKKKKRPDGIVASVEKLITPIYIACKELKLIIPGDIKLISFTNLQTALILDPPLSTITQPAFEMGKTAATILFKGIEKENFDLSKERIVIPSELAVRSSTRN